MNAKTLQDRLRKAEDELARAAETAARAHEDAPGSGVEADALDELVDAQHEADMAAAHLRAAASR